MDCKKIIFLQYIHVLLRNNFSYPLTFTCSTTIRSSFYESRSCVLILLYWKYLAATCQKPIHNVSILCSYFQQQHRVVVAGNIRSPAKCSRQERPTQKEANLMSDGKVNTCLCLMETNWYIFFVLHYFVYFCLIN